jgi:hypothetical protein
MHQPVAPNTDGQKGPISRNLKGGLRLFLRDPSGFTLIDQGVVGFWSSFRCALFILPAYFAILYSPVTGGGPQDVGIFKLVTGEIVFYVLGWIVWPAAFIHLMKLPKQKDAYIKYMTALNWSSAPMVMLVLSVTLVQENMPSDIALPLGLALSLGGLAWRFVVHGFIIKASFDQSRFFTVMMVLGDFMMGQTVISMRFSYFG